MADTQQDPVFQIQRIYLKDLSLEQPNSPAILLEPEQPTVDIQLGVDAQPVADGIFVLHPGVIDYIEGDATSWESTALMRLAQDDQLRAWEHRGFWQPMDTLRDKLHLEQLWTSERPPWKSWS